jgi:sulfate adenylyltransferase subunit 2
MSSLNIFGLDAPRIWDTESAFQHLKGLGQAETKRTAERKLRELGILPPALETESLRDESGQPPTTAVLQWEIGEARRKRWLVLFAQLTELPDGQQCLYTNDARGAHYWIPLGSKSATPGNIGEALGKLQAHLGKPVAVYPHGSLVAQCRALPPQTDIAVSLLSYPPVLNLSEQQAAPRPKPNLAAREMSHLDRLEAESIFILREALAQAENPAMLYSIGKDSSVMLHLARKAFFPATPPFPLLHVDTRWKFREMYLFRDYMAGSSGMDLLIHINPEAIDKDINPFDHGSKLHTDITKTEGLKQALDKYQFDLVFGGARRDEEKSRAKERIFSFRTETHHWNPKKQRPELWNLYNAQKRKGESIRVFPLSNWTELDVWQYIYRENIPIVPLYFARERPVVVRDGMILMIDDERMRLLPGEKIQRRKVRFRTLGCYPLSGAIDSDAETLPQIILELLNSRMSERQGRAIDTDSSGSMERKKQEGYF